MKSLFKNKKGISEIIITVIMIGLVLAAAAIVWGVVNSIISGKIKNTESCFGNFGKININSQYVCYDDTAKTFQFSLEVADVSDIDKILVSISGTGATKTFTLNTTGKVDNLANFGSTGFGTDTITIPSKNEGKSYITNFFVSKPDSIKIAPVIKGQQCDPSDTLNEISYCT